MRTRTLRAGGTLRCSRAVRPLSRALRSGILRRTVAVCGCAVSLLRSVMRAVILRAACGTCAALLRRSVLSCRRTRRALLRTAVLLCAVCAPIPGGSVCCFRSSLRGALSRRCVLIGILLRRIGIAICKRIVSCALCSRARAAARQTVKAEVRALVRIVCGSRRIGRFYRNGAARCRISGARAGRGFLLILRHAYFFKSRTAGSTLLLLLSDIIFSEIIFHLVGTNLI